MEKNEILWNEMLPRERSLRLITSKRRKEEKSIKSNSTNQLISLVCVWLIGFHWWRREEETCSAQLIHQFAFMKSKAAASHQQLNQLHQFQSTNPSIKLNFDWMDGVDGLMIDELVDGAAAANTNQNKNLIFIFICFRPSLLAFLHPSAKERFSICWLDSGRGRKEMKANQQTTYH